MQKKIILFLSTTLFLFLIISCEKEQKYDNFNNKLIQKDSKQLSLKDSTSEKKDNKKITSDHN